MLAHCVLQLIQERTHTSAPPSSIPIVQKTCGEGGKYKVAWIYNSHDCSKWQARGEKWHVWNCIASTVLDFEPMYGLMLVHTPQPCLDVPAISGGAGGLADNIMIGGPELWDGKGSSPARGQGSFRSTPYHHLNCPS